MLRARGNMCNEPSKLKMEECLAKTEILNGKTMPGMSVTEHGSLTASVYSFLVEKFHIEKMLNFISRTTLAAAIHDIGKISLPFQKKIWANVSEDIDKPLIEGSFSSDVSHAEISGKAVEDISGQLGLKYVVWNHHGKKFNDYPASSSKASFFGGETYHETRKQLYEYFLAKFGEFPDNISFEYLRLISGIVTVSDWLSSSILHSEYIASQENAALSAINRSGLKPLEIDRNITFADMFGFQPNEMQKTFIEKVNTSGIYILEAQMGLGKTEAAIYAAYRLIQQGKAQGIYFALPTQLTSLMIYDRVRNAARKFSDLSDDEIQLVFSGSDIYTTEGNELGFGGSWFDSRKRSILAPVGIGTIDQALMSAINVKHSDVRLFGLYNKVVILDEVHSYDMYTTKILERLVQLLKSLKSTVIILSATLNEDRRKALLGLGPSTSLSVSYPIVSCLKYDGTNYEEVEISTTEKKKVHIELEDDRKKLINTAIEAAYDGQYVLWIENTVDNAQSVYQVLSARLAGSEIEVGLIHSRFTKKDRSKNEAYWTSIFGKNNENRYCDGGKILVGTQVLEQSLDIDSDLLITRICPVDMLLQRIGRLWRHKKYDSLRTSKHPKCFICSPSLHSITEPTEDFDIDGIVYAPYYLYITLKVISEKKEICIPDDIRILIDEAYSKEHHETLLSRAKQEMIKLSERLETMARMSLNSTMEAENDNSFTRYSEVKTIDVLLLKDWKGVSCTTLDGNEISFDSKEKKRVSRGILENIVRANKNIIAIKPIDNSVAKILKTFVYVPEDEEERMRVCIVRDAALYDLSGNRIDGIRYTSMGLIKEKEKR